MDLLPHLARRIEISSLVIEFPRSGDKIILTGKSGTDDHYTISVGNDSGILDGHHTWRDGGINSLAECALKLDDAGVIKCVHGEHTKCYLERPAEAGGQKAASQTGESLGAKLELSHFRCG